MRAIVKTSEAQEPFSFTFINDEGRTILKSENYKAKKSAVNGIESVMKNCQVESRYAYKESKNGKYFFNVIAGNGQVVATSMLFSSPEERSHVISDLRRHGPRAVVEK